MLLADASMANNRFINANGTNANIANHYYSDIDFGQLPTANFNYSVNNGTYLVTFSARNRCGTSTNLLNVAISTLGVSGEENIENIIVYPNPVSSFVTLVFFKRNYFWRSSC